MISKIFSDCVVLFIYYDSQHVVYNNHHFRFTVKPPSSTTEQNLGDMMLGDQPPEERLGLGNEIESDKGKCINI